MSDASSLGAGSIAGGGGAHELSVEALAAAPWAQLWVGLFIKKSKKTKNQEKFEKITKNF